MTESHPDDAAIEITADAKPGGPSPAPGGSGAPATPASPTPEAVVAEAKREAAANYDRYLRAVADLENYRRRAIREKDELRQFGTAALIQDLLPVLDNLQLAVAAARQDPAAQSIGDGVGLVLDKLRAALTRHGLAEINPAGEMFDPHQHESLSHQPSAEVPEEHVMQVVRAGYRLNGRLLRPASVVLSSGPAKEAQP